MTDTDPFDVWARHDDQLRSNPTTPEHGYFVLFDDRRIPKLGLQQIGDA